MKETSANIENEERKYFLAEFSLDDGEYEIIFNIVDINFFAETITVEKAVLHEFEITEASGN